ncbi:SDR family oxidoreductase [Sphingobacterium endophyticum]|uniref:SDR family oxidoreductase n=1 Tax=Sphingobacterium endophyticum TaxID=2546448 RepID=UPI0012E120EC|nr:SDR family oxidoreductase [Sphingobacterium endophyticum]
MEIKNARILITGGATGMGYEMAKIFKEKGAEVLICGRTEKTVSEAAATLDVLGFTADVANEKEVENLFKFLEDKWNGIDVLINNAGVGYFSDLVSTTTEDFTRVWDINVKGAFLVGKEAAKIFIRQDKGNIINIGSTASLYGFANGSAYVASKFALKGLTECWRAELRKHNVRVMQINPSEVVTEFGAKSGYGSDDNGKKLTASEIAHVAMSMLTMNDVGFITDATVFATNP